MTFVLKMSAGTVVDDEKNHYRRKELPGLWTPAKKQKAHPSLGSGQAWPQRPMVRLEQQCSKGKLYGK